jgi:hypothetical protein
MFAALHFTLTMIPAVPAAGTGGAISLGMISAAVSGFLLGPVVGTFAVLIGSYVAMFVNAELMVLGLFTPIATATGALAAGFIRIRKPIGVFLLYIVSIVLYILSPIGIVGISFVWFHLFGLLLSLIIILPKVSTKFLDYLNFESGRLIIKKLEQPSKLILLIPVIIIIGGVAVLYLTLIYTGLEMISIILFAIGIISLLIVGMRFSNIWAESVFAYWVVAFLAVMIDQMMGSAIGVYYLSYFFGLDNNTIWGWWSAVMFLYPVERFFASLFAASLIVAISRTILNAFPLPSMPFTDSKREQLLLDMEEE